MTRINHRVAAEAENIVARLRDTKDSLSALMQEYGCAYNTIMAAILTQISKAEYQALAKKKLGQGGVAGRFKPGHVPWDKGRKGWCPPGCEATQFQPGGIRGNAARRYRPVGTITIRRGKRLSTQERARRAGSQRWIKIKDEGRPQDRYIPYARWLWEREHGPVPPGKFVGHADNNTMNDAPDNLILLDCRANMRRLYERPGVIAKCRTRSAAAARKRHKKNRAARHWRKLRQKIIRTIWSCEDCGADYGHPLISCPKCLSGAISERAEKERLCT